MKKKLYEFKSCPSSTFKQTTATNTGHFRQKISQRILRSVVHIHKSYRGDISLDDLAAKACMSRHHYNRAFKKIMRISPIKYLSLYRLNQACQLLAQTSWSITRVSQEVGFNQPSYFTAQFKLEAGITPSLYRKKRQAQ
ncbi:MAG: helix-turn-helix domain-containing protein [Arenicella sp.]